MIRYIELADRIIEDIESGVLTIGDRMPSVRQYAKLQEVSITSVLNCYRRLEELGWLVAKPQSGFYISAPYSTTLQPEFPSFTPEVSQNFDIPEESAQCQGPFYVSLIAPELIPVNKFTLTQKHTLARQTINFHLYPDYQGEPLLRESLAGHFNQQYFPVRSSDLVITNGCIDALMSAIEITTEKGDAVAICSPCFIGIIDLLIKMGRRVIEIPFHQAKVDLEQLERLFVKKTVKAFLLSANHINPQGVSIPTKQKIRIAELARQYEIPVIEDDIYLELSYAKLPPLPIKHWDKEGWVLWCGSFSKTLSPSLRVGWCHPGRYLAEYIKTRRVKTFGVNTPLQHVMANFINNGHYLRHVKQLRLTLSKQAIMYHQVLKANLPSNTRITTPQGGLVLWIQVPGLDAEKLLKAAEKKQINFRPGRQFTTRDYYQDCLRINIGWPISKEPSHSLCHQHYNKLVMLCEMASKLSGH